MGVIVKNRLEDEEVLPHIPTHPDGRDYLYEVISDGGSIRYYDDTVSGIMDFLIPGYESLSEEDQMTARILHAIQTRGFLQAFVNVELPDENMSEQEREIAAGDLSLPPVTGEWESSTPLVLVDAFYSPFSPHPAPVSAIADVVNPPNIWWLRPAASEEEYLRSLHDAYVLEVSVVNEEVAI